MKVAALNTLTTCRQTLSFAVQQESNEHFYCSHLTSPANYLISTNLQRSWVVWLTCQLLFNFRQLQNVLLRNQSGQLTDNCNMLGYCARHPLELWISLDKLLQHQEKQQYVEWKSQFSSVIFYDQWPQWAYLDTNNTNRKPNLAMITWHKFRRNR